VTRVLVTGATGLLGSRVCSRLREADCELLATSRRRPEGPPSEGLAEERFRVCDLRRREAVEELLAWARPDVILHTAAMTHVDGCERDPLGAFQANTEAAAWLALASRRHESHLVGVSTDYVFAGEGELPTEDAAPDPIGVYGATKLMAERAVQTFAASWAIARTCVVFGWPPARGANFGSWLVTELSAGRPVTLFRDQEVTPTWVDNAAGMVVELGLERKAGIWHTAGAESVDRVAFGLALCELMGYDSALVVPVAMAEVKLAARRPPRAGLTTSKAAQLLRHKPLPLAEALAGFAASCRAATGSQLRPTP
jgi:dTDP-4-dehydrorhamnose reductase